ncbi:MAG: hypothetical protein J6M02_02065 [Clostridia bacterium]|nr:hypothetical protein [Clostridia bacterium]
MEWKWIKTLLIVIFLCIDVVLGIMVYRDNKEHMLKPEVVEAVKEILEKRHISLSCDLEKVTTKRYMRKISISNEKEIVEKFIPLSEEKEWNYKGRRREIVSLTSVISLFLRDTDLKDTTITSIELGYYPEMAQINESVLVGEAIPVWRIVTGENTYLYNAYVGSRVE